MTSAATLDDVKALYAKLMAAMAGSTDPRFERAFELVPREAFLPPGPWRIVSTGAGRQYVETPTADPVHLYQNALVAIDVERGINNGEPFLHAAWLGAVAPRPGDVICHVGAGTGYYTALLSVLSLPGGRVYAFEIETDLAERARENLRPFESVEVTTGDATRLPLPSCDLIYVNAGIVAPPAAWLDALRPEGRMILPWRPTEDIGLSLLFTALGDGAFAVKPLMPSWFIPCVGASDKRSAVKVPTGREARSVRSAWLTARRQPDRSAVAVYESVWFSSEPASREATAA
jgi:protein-L-isoaspartate(D-aspartate) O-methyltransferase